MKLTKEYSEKSLCFVFKTPNNKMVLNKATFTGVENAILKLDASITWSYVYLAIEEPKTHEKALYLKEIEFKPSGGKLEINQINGVKAIIDLSGWHELELISLMETFRIDYYGRAAELFWFQNLKKGK